MNPHQVPSSGVASAHPSPSAWSPGSSVPSSGVLWEGLVKNSIGPQVTLILAGRRHPTTWEHAVWHMWYSSLTRSEKFVSELGLGVYLASQEIYQFWKRGPKA